MVYLNFTKFLRKNYDRLSDSMQELYRDLTSVSGINEAKLHIGLRRVVDNYWDSRGNIILVFSWESSKKFFIECFFEKDYAYDRDWTTDLYIYDTDAYGRCDMCGDLVCVDGLTFINDELYCDDCRDDNFFFCDRCQEWHSNNEQNTVYLDSQQRHYELWCDDCVGEDAWWCDGCEVFYSDDVSSVSTNNGTYCCDCADEHGWRQCDDCGEWFNWEGGYGGCDDDGNYYCDDCFPNHQVDEDNCIRSYHDNPSLVFHNKGADDIGKHKLQYIGTEIETEDGDFEERKSITWEFGDEEDTIYQMRDGSLNDSGIECITQPMTKLYWDDFNFEEWMRKLTNAGARSHDTEDCGLHVHLSREWMMTDNRDEQLLLVGRMRQFLADNSDSVKKFARRSEERWCQYSKAFNNKSEKEGLTKKEVEDKLKDSVRNNYNRYQAINNNNRNTIEFRIFRGTLNPNTYRASVEFCLRVVDYVRTHEEETLSWEEFLGYKELPTSMRTYLIQRHLLENDNQ